ncbi:MAG: helix-turn-helix domain-containing protein [Bilophila wadsworthia]
MSEKTLARLFIRQTGQTFGRWLQIMRLQHAMTEIEQGQSVTAVALDCGYNSVSAFISAFKKHFGSTPGAIAKRRHEREREREADEVARPAPSASPFRPIIENARRMIPSSGIFQLWQCL